MKYLSVLFLLCAACAPTRYVEPIPQDHWYATATAGGPLITYGNIVIPMPLTSLATGYGLAENTSLFGGLHTTALGFKDLQLDLGALQKVMDQDHLVPAISVSPVANLVYAMRDGAFRIWPEADVNFYWHYMPNGNFFYLTSSNWFELSGTRADGADQTNHWLKNFALGHTFDNTIWQYTVELKYLQAGTANQPGPVDYHGISGNGAFGIYLALTRKF